MEGNVDNVLDFEWYNEDMVGCESDLLDISRFFMNRLIDPSCEGTPMFFICENENFGFDNVLIRI